MKKIIIMSLLLMATISMSAQKFALIDMEYILKNIPAWQRANEKVNKLSQTYQAQVDTLNSQAATLYKSYQTEAANLSKEQKKAKQDAIVAKETEAAKLRQKYFGPEGELMKQRQTLLAPIQEAIYEVVKELSSLRGYSLVLDRSSDAAIIFGSPRIDISDEVLERLGYTQQ